MIFTKRKRKYWNINLKFYQKTHELETEFHLTTLLKVTLRLQFVVKNCRILKLYWLIYWSAYCVLESQLIFKKGQKVFLFCDPSCKKYYVIFAKQTIIYLRIHKFKISIIRWNNLRFRQFSAVDFVFKFWLVVTKVFLQQFLVKCHTGLYPKKMRL